MSNITRARNSTKRIAFKWSTTTGSGAPVPLDLTGMTLEMIVDTEKVESTPEAPVRVAAIPGVITNAATGQAYFPVTVSITGVIQTLYFEVWVTDANSETYPIDGGQLKIAGSLK